MLCLEQEKMLYVYDPKAMHSIFVKDQHAYDQPGWFFVLSACIHIVYVAVLMVQTRVQEQPAHLWAWAHGHCW